MVTPMSVARALPNGHEWVANIGAHGCSNLRIAHGLRPSCWLGIFENFENGNPMECVHEKAEVEQESDEELEMVGSTLGDVVYGTPKLAGPARKNVHPGETQARHSSPNPKAKARKRQS